MMLAGVPVLADAVLELADNLRASSADDLADRLERALDEDVKLLALTIDERAIILAGLEDPPEGLAELRALMLSEHQWRQREGLDPRSRSRELGRRRPSSGDDWGRAHLRAATHGPQSVMRNATSYFPTDVR